jgi:hypothetical protein
MQKFFLIKLASFVFLLIHQQQQQQKTSANGDDDNDGGEEDNVGLSGEFIACKLHAVMIDSFLAKRQSLKNFLRPRSANNTNLRNSLHRVFWTQKLTKME